MFSKVCKYMSEINYQLSDTPSSTYILLCQIMASKAASLLKKKLQSTCGRQYFRKYV